MRESTSFCNLGTSQIHHCRSSFRTCGVAIAACEALKTFYFYWKITQRYHFFDSSLNSISIGSIESLRALSKFIKDDHNLKQCNLFIAAQIHQISRAQIRLVSPRASKHVNTKSNLSISWFPRHYFSLTISLSLSSIILALMTHKVQFPTPEAMFWFG